MHTGLKILAKPATTSAQLIEQLGSDAVIAAYGKVLMADSTTPLADILAQQANLYVLGDDSALLANALASCIAPEGHVLTLIISGRIAFTSGFCKSISNLLAQSHLLPGDMFSSFRLLLHESVLNALEHGHLGLAKHKLVNQDNWFDRYYEEVSRTLRTTPAGNIPLIIQIAQAHNKLQVWVEDQGNGFEQAQEKPQALQPFGMGQQLMQHHASQLVYEKDGRCIHFELSYPAEPTPQDVPQAMATASTSSTPCVETSYTLSHASFPRCDSKVLVVDDQAANRELAVFYLRSAGYSKIEQAASGEEALQKVADFNPDIILLDIIMPGMTGFEICAQLQQNPATARIPVLFLSGLTDVESRTKGYRSGAVDYVNKPINKEELIARTDVHIRNGSLLRSLESYAQRVSEELDRARRFQLTLLPNEEALVALQSKHNIQLQSHFQASAELAGDYWTTFQLSDDCISIILADFTGHGVVAALNTVRLHALCLELEDLRADPELFVSHLNDRLLKLLPTEHFCTLFYGMLNTRTGEMVYVSCGAPAPVLVPVAGCKAAPLFLPSSSLPLGITPSHELKINVKTMQLNKGDTLFLYSDALTESKMAPTAHRWGEELLMAHMLELKALPGDMRLHHLLRTFYRQAQKPLIDDLTLVSITRG